MKKTPKKVLGLVGLGIVVATTVFAGSIPRPEALAADNNSITDTITVRVVGSEADVNIIKPVGDEIFTSPNIIGSIQYENVEFIDVALTYINKNNVSTDYDLGRLNPDYQAGSTNIDINLDDPDGTATSSAYKYGDYTFYIKGIGINAFDESVASFKYLPIILEAEQTSEDGEVTIKIDDYDHRSVDHVDIEIRDSSGNTITTLDSIKLPTEHLIIDFSEYDLESGNYIISATAYDEDSKPLYLAFEFTLAYTEPEAPYVPETGSLFTKLNISKVDYLATGLIIFFAFAILGLVFTVKKRNYCVARTNKNSSKNRMSKANHSNKITKKRR